MESPQCISKAAFWPHGVEEVRSVIARRVGSGPVRADLTELRYADAAGIELLRALRAQGIEITSSSPYSSALL